jgi:hypothetical protein
LLCCSDFYRAWLLWVCLGLWHGFACFYVPTLTLGGWAGVSVSGSHASVEELGTAIMTAILVTVTLRVSRVLVCVAWRGSGVEF